MAGILRRSKAPRRQLDTQPDGSGAWGEVVASINSMMLSGFIVALLGDRGTGKTQAAVEVMRTAAAIAAGRNRRARERSGAPFTDTTPVVYAKALDVFINIRATYNGGDESEKKVIEQYAKPMLLVIDELQERGNTAWEDRLLTHIIDTRYSSGLDTILIANLNPEEFRKAVGPSIYSRIVETGMVIECDWPSFRKPRSAP